MQIKIKRTAKILEADLTLDGVTVIAGYNDMGKSTLLKAAYIAFRTCRDPKHNVNNERRKSLKSYFGSLESYFDSEGYDMLPRELLSVISDKVISQLEAFRDEKKDSFSRLKMIFVQSLEECMQELPKEETQDFFSDMFLRPVYEHIKKIANRDIGKDLGFITEMYIRNLFKGQMNSLYDYQDAEVSVVSESEHYQIRVRENKVVRMEFSANSEAEVFYLPAYHLLDITEYPVLRIQSYSPESDLRKALISSEKEPTFEEYQETEQNVQLVKDILAEVLHGTLEKSPAGRILFKDRELDSHLDIANVASGMKNFLMIQSLVERGKLKKNGILMIDEPETNLHPQWQLKFAEALVLLYKYMGVRSIVSSHSPYLIRAIEVKMADENLKDKGHYYLMKEADSHMYCAKDVTRQTDAIYELLYQPLEYL